MFFVLFVILIEIVFNNSKINMYQNFIVLWNMRFFTKNEIFLTGPDFKLI